MVALSFLVEVHISQNGFSPLTPLQTAVSIKQNEDDSVDDPSKQST